MKIKTTCLICSTLLLFFALPFLSAQSLKHVSSSDGVHFSNRFEGYFFSERAHQNRTFIQVEAQDYVAYAPVGHPALPARISIIEIPQGATLRVEIISSQYQDYLLKDLAGIDALLWPMQAPLRKAKVDKTPFAIQEDAYKNTAWAQTSLVETEIIGESRGVRLAKIIVKPMDYSPAQGRVRIYQDIQFKVHFVESDMNSTATAKVGLQDINVHSRLQGVLPLPQTQAKNVIGSTAPIRYVIIAHPRFEAALQPFIQWKRQKGFAVEMAFVGSEAVGSTTTSIQSYLKGLYDDRTETKPAPSYILLAGDTEEIPAFITKVPTSSQLVSNTDKHVTDLYYAEYTGDYLPDVYYGRFSASSTVQMEAIVEKTIAMEKLTIPSTDFLGKTMLIAGSENRQALISLLNRTIDYITTHYVNTENNITPIVYRSPDSENRVQEIRSGISGGVGIVNYTAHGDWNEWQGPVITINHINNLSNTDKYPVVIGNCCLTSKFERPECFAEAWLRAYRKGAVAYLGASNSSYFTEDYWWSVGGIVNTTTTPTYQNTKLGVYDRLFHTHNEKPSEWIMSLGEIIYQGNMAVEHSGGSSFTHYMYQYYWEIYHVMGDPSFMPYTHKPSEINVTCEDILLSGFDQIEVTAEPYAYVGLSVRDSLIGAGLCNDQGVAKIKMFKIPTVGDDVKLVVTAQNKVPFFKTISVVSSDKPFVRSTEIILDPVASSNNALQLGQPYQVKVALENMTDHLANNTIIEFSSSDTNVVITKGSASVTDIAAHQQSTVQSAFSFYVKAPAQDKQTVKLKLKAKCGDGQFTEQHYIYTLQAPNPIMVSYNIQTPTNRFALKGESTLKVKIRNGGSVAMTNVDVAANCTKEGVSIQVLNPTISNINAGFSADIQLVVTLNQSIEVNDLLNINLSLSSPKGQYLFTIIGSAGAVTESFTEGFNPQLWTENSSWIRVETERGMSAKSPTVSHNSSAEMRTKPFDYYGVDSLRFFCKVSSESFSGGGDGLEIFLVKEATGGEEASSTLVGYIYGEVPWTRISIPMPKGLHSVVFSYAKDEMMTEGEDAAWVDDIVLASFDGKFVNANKDPQGLAQHLMFDVVHSDHRLHARVNAQTKGNVRIELRDPLGRLVALVADKAPYQSGANDYYLNTENLVSGLYICVFITDQTSVARKIIVH